jgi:hypothetical protein
MPKMQKLFIKSTKSTPEIIFSPEENKFIIRGASSPEDVRALYYPVVDWIKIFVDDFIEGEYPGYTRESPLVFNIDLSYFNSSSAKFLFDILTELKRLIDANKPVVVQWLYDNDDPDQKEAGIDMSSLVGIGFKFIPKSATKK